MHFRVGHKEEAARLIKKHHYSHRMPGVIAVCGTWHQDGGLFGDYGDCVAACLLGEVVAKFRNENSEVEHTLELQRLCRLPDTELPPLSGLISITCKEARRRGFDLVVSYADTAQDHHGGIYQAASWNYNGQRDVTKLNWLVDGQKVHGRSMHAKHGTQKREELDRIYGDRIERDIEPGKHLYWKALNKRGKAKAKRIGLKSEPYCKPEVDDGSSSSQ